MECTRALKLFVNVFALLILSNLCGQQLPQYTLFAINPYSLNPAIAGTENFTSLLGASRTQWNGFKGAPKTFFFGAHAPINKKSLGYYNEDKFSNESWLSLGTIFISDKTGPLSQTSGYASIAYNLPMFNRHARLSFGMNIGIKNFRFDPQGFSSNLLDPDDPVIQNSHSDAFWDIAAGMWFYSRKFFLGFSSYQLTNSSLQDLSKEEGVNFTGNLQRHYFGMSGLRLDIDPAIYSVLSVLVKSIPPSPVSYEFNLKFVHQKGISTGASYRWKDSFALFAGVLIDNKLEATYSFDIITSSINQSAFGSNEIVLVYRISKKQGPVCPDMFW